MPGRFKPPPELLPTTLLDSIITLELSEKQFPSSHCISPTSSTSWDFHPMNGNGTARHGEYLHVDSSPGHPRIPTTDQLLLVLSTPGFFPSCCRAWVFATCDGKAPSVPLSGPLVRPENGSDHLCNTGSTSASMSPLAPNFQSHKSRSNEAVNRDRGML